jgi:hypothetical protein
MPTHVLIEAAVPAHLDMVSFVCVAGRSFELGQHHVIVLDQEEDPPQVEIAGTDQHTGSFAKRLGPDPMRMGKKSFRELQADARFRIVNSVEETTP